jgi:hypothetical protein
MMPRRSTHEAAEILADRLINRGHEGSHEWVSAWLRRWGSVVAQDTENDPLFQHPVNKADTVLVGIDTMDLNLYREWRDIQDGSRKIMSAMGERARWED